MSERRITVEIVRKAYELTGLGPIACNWIESYSLAESHCCGCPQTAMYLVRHPKDRSDRASLGSKVLIWASTNYGREYADAFRAGFDCGVDEGGESRLRERVSSWRLDRSADQRRVDQGVEDGRACRAEFIDRPKSAVKEATV